MTSEEKISEILKAIQNTIEPEWGTMQWIKQDLEELVSIAKLEGVKETHHVIHTLIDKYTR